MKRLLAVLSLGIVSSWAAAQSDSLYDYGNTDSKNPKYAWIYDCMKSLKSSGFLVGYPDGFVHGYRPPTRFEFAVADHATYVHLRNALEALTKGDSKDKNVQESFAIAKSLLPCLKRLTIELSFELAALGVDVPAMLGDISRLSGDKVQPSQSTVVHDPKQARIFNQLYKLQSFSDDYANPTEPIARTAPEVALGVFNLFQVMDRRIDRASQLEGSFEGAIRAVDLAERGSELLSSARPYFPELERLGVDTKEMQHRIAGWKDQIETVWSPTNLLKWKDLDR